MPGELERIMVWFRDYKIPDGKPPNAFGYDGKPMNSEFAEMVIAGTHNLCACPLRRLPETAAELRGCVRQPLVCDSASP